MNRAKPVMNRDTVTLFVKQQQPGTCQRFIPYLVRFIIPILRSGQVYFLPGIYICTNCATFPVVAMGGNDCVRVDDCAGGAFESLYGTALGIGCDRGVCAWLFVFVAGDRGAQVVGGAG